jgi:hypothetical protein
VLFCIKVWYGVNIGLKKITFNLCCLIAQTKMFCNAYATKSFLGSFQMLFFLTFYSSKNPEKKISTILSRTTEFNIDDSMNNNNNSINKCFLSTKSAYYNNVTLKTGVMAKENSELP